MNNIELQGLEEKVARKAEEKKGTRRKLKNITEIGVKPEGTKPRSNPSQR